MSLWYQIIHELNKMGETSDFTYKTIKSKIGRYDSKTEATMKGYITALIRGGYVIKGRKRGYFIMHKDIPVNLLITNSSLKKQSI
jgi:hypothetical protein